MNKFKRAAAAVLASAMVLALTACDERHRLPAATPAQAMQLLPMQTQTL